MIEIIDSVPSYSFPETMSLTFVLTVKQKGKLLQSLTFLANLVE